MEEQNTMIYVAFHRSGKIIFQDNHYQPIQVGKSISGIELDMLNDAEGVNISDKNNTFSELTGWYWIWKNKRHKIVGTSHYRRFFTTEKPSPLRKTGNLFLFLAGQQKKRHGLLCVASGRKWRDRILDAQQIQLLMKDFDVLLPVKKKFPYSVYQQYKRRHNEKDIAITKEIIAEIHPDYFESFDKTFSSNEMYPFNMFVLSWKLFDAYMSWLFPILFELEKRSEIDLNDKYQKRVCAFMAERLLTVWVNHNRLRVKELYVLYFKIHKTRHF